MLLFQVQRYLIHIQSFTGYLTINLMLLCHSCVFFFFFFCRTDPSICKPQVYHQHDCNIRSEAGQTEIPDSEDSIGEGRCVDRLTDTDNPPLSCSCGAEDKTSELKNSHDSE